MAASVVSKFFVSSYANLHNFNPEVSASSHCWINRSVKNVVRSSKKFACDMSNAWLSLSKCIWEMACIWNPANIYLFKAINRNTRKSCEIYSKLTIKPPAWRHWRSGVFTVNVEHISYLFLLCYFEQVNVNWEDVLHGSYLLGILSIF